MDPVNDEGSAEELRADILELAKRNQELRTQIGKQASENKKMQDSMPDRKTLESRIADVKAVKSMVDKHKARKLVRNEALKRIQAIFEKEDKSYEAMTGPLMEEYEKLCEQMKEDKDNWQWALDVLEVKDKEVPGEE